MLSIHAIYPVFINSNRFLIATNRSNHSNRNIDDSHRIGFVVRNVRSYGLECVCSCAGKWSATRNVWNNNKIAHSLRMWCRWYLITIIKANAPMLRIVSIKTIRRKFQQMHVFVVDGFSTQQSLARRTRKKDMRATNNNKTSINFRSSVYTSFSQLLSLIISLFRYTREGKKHTTKVKSKRIKTFEQTAFVYV